MVIMHCKYCGELINIFKPSDWEVFDEHIRNHKKEKEELRGEQG
jgi:hypothetical protein